MNERIRQLAEQARVQDRGYFIYQYGGPTGHQSVEKAIDLEKFAELIVKECIDQVAGTKIVGQLLGDEFAGLTESADNKYKQWNNALVIATMNVRDHFGVKE